MAEKAIEFKRIRRTYIKGKARQRCKEDVERIKQIRKAVGDDMKDTDRCQPGLEF